jgi:hypothetical protein
VGYVRKGLAFSRDIIFEGQRSFIQSVCLRCGSILRGTVSDGLPDWETEHNEACAKRVDIDRHARAGYMDRQERS